MSFVLALFLMTSPDSSIDAVHVFTHGDRIRIGVAEMTEDYVLNPAGEVLIRGLGTVRLAGMTTAEAERDLSDRITTLTGRSVPVSVILVEPATPRVFVAGAVARPGWRDARSLVDALTAAQPTPHASLSAVAVEKASGETFTIDYAAILTGEAHDIAVEGGDRLVVPIRPPEIAEDSSPGADTPAGVVNVLGEVSKPSAVAPGRLTEILVAAGGITENSRTRDITIRTAAGESSRVSLDDILGGRSDDPDIPAGATVFVASSAPARRFWSDLRAILGALTAAILLGARL